MKSLKILLINPAQLSKHMAKTSRTFRVPQNTLATLAALTPHDDVKIVDELIEDVNYEEEADVVGVTAMTDNVIRAYQIADEFRKRGYPVVLGGPHPTAVPNESLKHADAVVKGEAEGLWEDLVEKIRKGKRPKGIFQRSTLPSMENIARPRRDLLKKEHYIDVDIVQTTRGCPHQCEFCSVNKFFGRKVRSRPVRDIVAEMDEDCGRRIFFVDDNLTGNISFAKKLFREMAPLKKEWIAQVTVNTGRDTELVKLISKSGCTGVFIGIESVDQATLIHMNKRQNKADKFLEQIKNMQDHGIPLLGAFVFGFDTDDHGIFQKTLDFLDKTKLDLAQFTIITPLPGTDLYTRWQKEKKLRYKDWWLSQHWTEVLFHPEKMTPEELQRGWVNTSVEYYKQRQIMKRVSRNLVKNGLRKSLLIAQMNLSYRESAMHMAVDLDIKPDQKFFEETAAVTV
ncbi:MAG: B12-binding domain-containing radical SAM protein [Spirochaetia bacterium]|nr:B12-binding domain-containing radical SAM protein [Spirochaetia bacterium]